MRTRAILLATALIAGFVTFSASTAQACATSTGVVAYIERVGCNASLWVMQYDGSAPQQLTAPAGSTFSPKWSPDGTRILYSSWTDSSTRSDLWVFDVVTGTSSVLLPTAGDQIMPDWSPDASRIVYVEQGTNSELWTMRPDGSDRVQITTLGASASEPSWSPDGSRILFSTDVNTRWDLYTIRPDGTGLARITSPSTTGWDVVEGSWSPDGATIVATVDSGYGLFLTLLDADGSNVRDLTPNACRQDYTPSFTIDGTHVLFTRADPDTAIYIIPIDGSAGPTQIGPIGQNVFRTMPVQSPPLVTTTTTSTTVAPVAATPRFTC